VSDDIGANVLVIEDDPDVQEVLQYNLGAAKHQVRVASTGAEGLQLARRDVPDVALLDMVLPDILGTDVCTQLKSDPVTSAVHVIIVSAKGQEADRIRGFEVGADDYVVKPFSVRELVLRIRVALRRSERPPAGSVVVFGSLRFDRLAHRAWVNGAEVSLTALDFRILMTLHDLQNRVQTREQIVSLVWGGAPEIEARTIDTHVKRLREKLGDAGRYVQTVRGVGYRFSAAP
jgi:two-component system phosphate regulon response regulator PhoB